MLLRTLVNKVSLKILLIINKLVEKIIKRMQGNILKVAYTLNLNIKGYRIRKIFAYILPGQADKLVLKKL